MMSHSSILWCLYKVAFCDFLTKRYVLNITLETLDYFLGSGMIVPTEAVPIRNQFLKISVIRRSNYNNLEVKYEDNTWFEETPLRGRDQHLSDYASPNHRDGRL